MTHAGSNRKHTWVHLMHENKILQKGHANEHGNHHQSTASAVVKVNKGEHVYGRLDLGIIYSNGHYWCHFVGFLVQKM